MQHQGTVVIETERLILRPFKIEDADYAFKNWTNDDKVTRFLTWPTHKDKSVTQKIIADWVASYHNKNFYQWAIELKTLKEPIGTISVVGSNEKTAMLHIGFAIGSKWWNQGYASEALSAIIPFLFEEVKARRIESQHDPNNPGSGKVMQKCGLTLEGRLRKADRNNQGIVDACVYSILAEEYFKEKTEN